MTLLHHDVIALQRHYGNTSSVAVPAEMRDGHQTAELGKLDRADSERAGEGAAPFEESPHDLFKIAR
jgi:hypothetical protein